MVFAFNSSILVVGGCVVSLLGVGGCVVSLMDGGWVKG
jgi:hypothetical protein